MQVTLTVAQYERLRLESTRTGLTVAALIRRALDHVEDERREDVLNGLGESFGAWHDRSLDGAI
jgi:hypothetical protein